MPTDQIQPAFTAGELAPSFHGRVDLLMYSLGLKTCKNFIVHGHGGVTNRPGKDFVGATKDHSKRSRLIPFSFSTVQTYALEFGDQYMRVIKDGGHVLEPSVVITGATQANPIVVSAAAHGYSDGDEVFIDAITGMTELNGFRFIVANKTAGTFELAGIDGTGYTAYGAGGTVARIFTLVTPYLEADLHLLKYFQSADVMTLTHIKYEVRDLTRTDHHVWSLSTLTFAPSIAAPTGESATGSGTSSFQVTAIAEETLEESLPTAAIDGGALPSTVTWTDPGGIERWNVYMLDNGLYGFVGSTEVNSFTVAAGTLADTALNPPKARNPFFGADNYPGAGAYFEQKKCFAGTNNEPQKEWMTQTGNFVNMGQSIPLKDDDAVDFTLNSLKVNQIKHLVPMEELLTFTSGSEWKIGSGEDAFTPSTMRVRSQGAVGCSDVPPVVIGDTVLFVQEKGNSVRDFGFTEGTNTYRGQDLTLWANHLFRGFEIEEWAFAQVPFSVIWCVRNDGKMVALTYLKDQEVWAWHQHETEGIYESVCSISEGQEDAVYVIVNRTINGSTKRYVEKMHTRYFDTIEDAFFVDSGLSFGSDFVVVSGATQASPVVVTATGHGFSNGQEVRFSHIKGMTELNQHYFKAANVTANTFELQNTDSVDIDGTEYSAYVSGGEVRETITTVTGLDHLEGESLAILADGSVHPPRTVVDGSITLQRAASEIHAGLGYVSDIETLDLVSQVGGAGQAKQKKISALTLKVELSRGFWAGNTEDTLTEFKQRTDEDYGVPTRMTTGIEKIILDPAWKSNGRLLVRQIDPLPLTILAVIPSVSIGG